MTRSIRRTKPARVAAAALSSVALMAALSACGGSASGESGDALSDVDLVFDGAGGVTLSINGDVPVVALSTIPALDDEGSLQWKVAAPAAGATRSWHLDFIAARFEVAGRVI